jgi:DNA-binding PadR family transcriptional regulator
MKRRRKGRASGGRKAVYELVDEGDERVEVLLRREEEVITPFRLDCTGGASVLLQEIKEKGKERHVRPSASATSLLLATSSFSKKTLSTTM